MRSPMMAANFADDAEQEVRTPPDVIARVVAAFGGQAIALDPCAPTRSDPAFFAERYVREAENGLGLVWVDRSFFNPPFADLRPWLEHARTCAAAGARIVGLVPARTHRAWFQDAMISARATTFLGGVKFVGHKTPFPAPLCLISWNCVCNGPAVAVTLKGDPA